MEYLISFLIGGAICAVVQLFMDNTKLLPGRIMVILVCLGAVLSALHLYEPFANWAKAGATVPLIGFGHLLFEGVKEEGLSVSFMVVWSGRLSVFQGHLSSAFWRHWYLSQR